MNNLASAPPSCHVPKIVCAVLVQLWLACCALAILCATAAPTAAAQKVPATGANAAAAERPAQPSAPADVLYGQNCAICHGPAGEGRICPQLARRDFDRAGFTARVRAGGRAMPAFKPEKLSDADVGALFNYIGRFPQPAASDLVAAPDASSPGGKLYAAACAMCHAPDARGLMGPGILNTPVDLAGFTEQVHQGGNGMPPFPQMADGEIRSIYEFLHPRQVNRGDANVGDVIRIPGSPRRVPASFAILIAVLVALVAAGLAGRARGRRRLAAQRADDQRVIAQLGGSSEAIRIRVL